MGGLDASVGKRRPKGRKGDGVREGGDTARRGGFRGLCIRVPDKCSLRIPMTITHHSRSGIIGC